MSPHTVLQFTFIEFDTNWKPAPAPQFAMYTAIEPARLKVVAEDQLGSKRTYHFQVAPKEIVAVSYSENLVFIPARCTSRDDKDTTTCGKVP